jgi:hypothetical protein
LLREANFGNPALEAEVQDMARRLEQLAPMAVRANPTADCTGIELELVDD